MRRWNGWGDVSISYPFPLSAGEYLAGYCGPGTALPAVRLEDVRVPASRLPAHPLITTDPEARIRHALGQSLPDVIRLRTGTIPAFPDGVACPTTEEQIRQIVDFARQAGLCLIPYGGGTSVVGGVTVLPGDAPVVTVDLARLRRLVDLDETSRLATFEAGVTGPHVEAQLRAHGYVLGHFPQSFEYSTLGGWIASRSTGQQSLRYGRIEGLFAGGRVETPIGTLELPPHPASAAGPDLRQIVLGSEGRLGIITRATLRVLPLPEHEEFRAVAFPGWAAAVPAVRQMAQADLSLSMLRLSDAAETETFKHLSSHTTLIAAGERLLSLRGIGDERCLLIFGVTGDKARVRQGRQAVLEIAKAHAGVHLGRFLGNEWRKSRFRTPYLRDVLLDHGWAVDTLETAIRWAELPATAERVLAALRSALAGAGERVLAFAHISHVYSDGGSLYFTFLFRPGRAADEALHRWQTIKDAASRAVVAAGGTISHQHGVGTDHLPYLPAEKGAPGIAIISSVCRAVDPTGMMNPGKLESGG